MIGMLWFDNDEQSDLAAKVERAAKYYQIKYGKKPNLCFVHPSVAPKDGVSIPGVEVRGTRAMMQNHLLIGVEQPAKASSPIGVAAQGAAQ